MFPIDKILTKNWGTSMVYRHWFLTFIIDLIQIYPEIYKNRYCLKALVTLNSVEQVPVLYDILQLLCKHPQNTLEMMFYGPYLMLGRLYEAET